MAVVKASRSPTVVVVAVRLSLKNTHTSAVVHTTIPSYMAFRSKGPSFFTCSFSLSLSPAPPVALKKSSTDDVNTKATTHDEKIT